MVQVFLMLLAPSVLAQKAPTDAPFVLLNAAHRQISGARASSQSQVPAAVIYKNQRYGFQFRLPPSWNGYAVQVTEWRGGYGPDGNPREHGPEIILRHPLWTAGKPRQDIPLMILTPSQWHGANGGGLVLGPAGVPPGKVCQNDRYIFALPARFDMVELPGQKEVEGLLSEHPCSPLSKGKPHLLR